MNEPVVTLTLSRLAASAAWMATVTLGAVGWVVFMSDREELAQMFGFTACITSAVAATLSVRCYASRLSRLIRQGYGTSPTSARPLRSIGD